MPVVYPMVLPELASSFVLQQPLYGIAENRIFNRVGKK